MPETTAPHGWPRRLADLLDAQAGTLLPDSPDLRGKGLSCLRCYATSCRWSGRSAPRSSQHNVGMNDIRQTGFRSDEFAAGP